MRAGVPIVPTAVMGAEEAMPIFAHVPLLQRLTGLIYFPINHAFPHFGVAAGLMYLPAKFRIRFLEPIDLSGYGPEDADDIALVGGSPRASGCGSRRSSTSSYWRASRSGSGKFPGRGDEGSSLLGLATRRSARRRLRRRRLQERGARARAGRAHGRDPGRQGHGLAGELGAGPVSITISNQTDAPRTITLEGESIREREGPVEPGDTATIQKTLEPGSYEVRAGSEKAVRKEIQPAVLAIGKERKNSNNDLLLP